VALAFIDAIFLAELVTTYDDAHYGMVLYIALLVCTLALSASCEVPLDRPGRLQPALRARQALGGSTAQPPDRALLLAMAIPPLVRIVELGTPFSNVPTSIWYIATGLPLIAATIIISRELALTREDLSLRLPTGRLLAIDLAVCASGIALGLIQWAILRPVPLVLFNDSSAGAMIAASMVALVFTGFLYELLFRGLLQHVAGTIFGILGGIVFCSVVYGLLSLSNGSVPYAAYMLGVSLYFGFVVHYTRSLLGVSLAHGIMNILVLVVFPVTLAAAR
jgi:membrane protease YdiL (CAAX protease family)